jgi:hypothetical protein
VVRKLFLTPSALPEDTQCRGLVIPASQDWLALFSAALLQTIYAYNYEQVNPTDLTPEQAAAKAFEVYEAWLFSTCAGGVCVPRMGGQRLTRKNPTTGEFEQIADDGETWEEPTDDIAIPPPATRPESTDDLRKCAAATNAAHVMHELYLAALNYYENEVDPAAAFDGTMDGLGELVLEALGILLKAAGWWASFAWEALYTAMSLLTSSVWDEAFDDELTCLFLQHATIADGKVTFAYGNLQNAIFTLGGTDPNRILLVWQVYYFLSIIGADGLNLSGGTTAVEGDCGDCFGWCNVWGPGELTDEFELLEGHITTEGHATWDFYSPPFDGAYRRIRLRIPALNTSQCFINRIEVRLWKPAGGNDAYIYLNALPGYGSTLDYTYLNWTTEAWVGYKDTKGQTTGASTDVDLRITSNHDAGWNISGIRIEGEGVNPFTTGSEC